MFFVKDGAGVLNGGVNVVDTADDFGVGRGWNGGGDVGDGCNDCSKKETVLPGDKHVGSVQVENGMVANVLSNGGADNKLGLTGVQAGAICATGGLVCG